MVLSSKNASNDINQIVSENFKVPSGDSNCGLVTKSDSCSLSVSVKSMIISHFREQLEHANMNCDGDSGDEFYSYDVRINSIIKDDEDKNSLFSYDLYSEEGPAPEKATNDKFFIIRLKNYAHKMVESASDKIEYIDKIVFITTNSIISTYNSDTSFIFPFSYISYPSKDIRNISYNVFKNPKLKDVYSVNVSIEANDGTINNETYLIDVKDATVKISSTLSKLNPSISWIKGVEIQSADE